MPEAAKGKGNKKGCREDGGPTLVGLAQMAASDASQRGEHGPQLVRALSLRVGGVLLESGVALDSSATMSQDVAIAFKAKNFSHAIALSRVR